MYKGVLFNAFTIEPEIVDIEFEIRGEYIYIVKGGVTGYEGAPLKKIVNDYVDKSMFTCWVACMGTYRKYHRLSIPMYEIIKYLINNNLIELERECGYIKGVKWLGENINGGEKE